MGLTAKQKRWAVGWLVALTLLLIIIVVEGRDVHPMADEKDRIEANNNPTENKRPNAALHALYTAQGFWSYTG